MHCNNGGSGIAHLEDEKREKYMKRDGTKIYETIGKERKRYEKK